MLIFSMLKPCFVFVLLILFFVLIGLESIDKFQAKQTILLRAPRNMMNQTRPAITVCATTNGYAGCGNYKTKENFHSRRWGTTSRQPRKLIFGRQPYFNPTR